MMNRRDFLGAAGAGFALQVVPFSTRAKETPGATHFSLEAMAGTAHLLPVTGMETGVWQYNGQTPGPVIRINQGERIRVPFTNRLPQPTSIHWHGLRIDNAMDGVPGLTQPLIEPGQLFTYEFVPPDAGTYWYHTHNRSWEQLARGLYGVLIVEERDPPFVDQDLVWVIDDWRLASDGNLEESSLGNLHDWAHGGRLGNVLTVNGKPSPEFPVRSGERIRLRIVNVANSRIMDLRFTNAHPQIVAVDGQPVKPVGLTLEPFILAPGQRVDLIMDMDQDPGERTELQFVAGQQPLTAASLVYHPREVLREHPLSSSVRLPGNPLPKELDLAEGRRVPLVMEGGAMGRLRGAEYKGERMTIRELIAEKQIWALNGIAGLADEPLFRVERGETVIIEIDNANRWPHAMHVHGHHFKAVEMSGAEESLWRDTLLLEGGEKREIAFLAVNPGKWLIHCHMIEHQAGGMATWFEVV